MVPTSVTLLTTPWDTHTQYWDAWFKTWLPCASDPASSSALGRQQMMVQVLGFLLPILETKMEYLTVAFGLLQLYMLQSLGE